MGSENRLSTVINDFSFRNQLLRTHGNWFVKYPIINDGISAPLEILWPNVALHIAFMVHHCNTCRVSEKRARKNAGKLGDSDLISPVSSVLQCADKPMPDHDIISGCIWLYMTALILTKISAAALTRNFDVTAPPETNEAWRSRTTCYFPPSAVQARFHTPSARMIAVGAPCFPNSCQ